MNIGGRITKRADGRYEARYEKGRNPDGSIKYGFCYGKTSDEAEWKRSDAITLLKNENACADDLHSVLMLYKNASTEAQEDLMLISKIELINKPLREFQSRDIYRFLAEYKKTRKPESVVELYNAFNRFFDFACKNGFLVVSPIEKSEQIGRYIEKMKSKCKSLDALTQSDYLTVEQKNAFVAELFRKPNERKFGLYLALQMGLSFSEIVALTVDDVDVCSEKLMVDKKIVGRKLLAVPKRMLVMPQSVREYCESISDCYAAHERIVKQGKRSGSTSILISELSRLNTVHGFEAGCDGEKLRSTFAVERLLAGIDVISLAGYMGEDITTMLQRYEPFIHTDLDSVITSGSEEPCKTDGKMNLLILGAGAYGRTVKEIAERIGVFDTIAFVDDDIEKSNTIGTCSDYIKLRRHFNAALPAFGDNELRQDYIEKLITAGYIVPRLIHPTATVSPSANISNGVIVEANATVNANAKVGIGSLICSSSLVDRGAVISPYCHIDSNATVAKDSIVNKFTHIKTGMVFTN